MLLQTLGRLVKERGIAGSVRRLSLRAYQFAEGRWFDKTRRVETGGWIPPGEGPEQPAGNGFSSVPARSLRRAIQAIPGLRIEEFTFYDVGCGKGKGLLTAAEFPFLRAVGVELSPALAGISEANLRAANLGRQRCRDLTVIQGDACTEALPSGPLILFMFHAFRAPVLRRFLEHCAESLRLDPRPAYLIYVAPDLTADVANTLASAAILRPTHDQKSCLGEIYRVRTFAIQPPSS